MAGVIGRRPSPCNAHRLVTQRSRVVTLIPETPLSANSVMARLASGKDGRSSVGDAPSSAALTRAAWRCPVLPVWGRPVMSVSGMPFPSSEGHDGTPR